MVNHLVLGGWNLTACGLPVEGRAKTTARRGECDCKNCQRFIEASGLKTAWVELQRQRGPMKSFLMQRAGFSNQRIVDLLNAPFSKLDKKDKAQIKRIFQHSFDYARLAGLPVRRVERGSPECGLNKYPRYELEAMFRAKERGGQCCPNCGVLV